MMYNRRVVALKGDSSPPIEYGVIAPLLWDMV